jgi:hypothetical protein
MPLNVLRRSGAELLYWYLSNRSELYVYSDTAILIFLPLLIVELVAPAAEEDICYGNDRQKYRAQYRQRISEHFFCGIGIVILAAHNKIPLL